jgi:hypothetical protein
MGRLPVLALAVAMVTATANSPVAQTPPLSAVMQQKAQNAQALLIPVVLSDFGGIERYATRLGRLTLTEVASWQEHPNSEYEKQANAFLRALEDLGRAADAHDAKRALTSYTDLVSSCVNCHQLARPKRAESLKAPAPILDPNMPGSRK